MKNFVQVLSNHFGEPSFVEVEDFIHAYGKASQALILVKLFCPDIVEIGSSILLRSAVSDEDAIARFKEKIAGEGASRSNCESSFNFVELPYLFSGSGRDTSDKEDEILAKYVAEAWQAWLQFKYPGRTFKVSVLSPRETGSVVGITFHEQ